MYVIIRCSPKQMGTYKYFLLLNASHCLVIDVWMALFQPEAYAPHPVIVIRGLATFINKDVVVASVFVCVAGISGTGYTTVYLFVFRFLQTTDHPFQRYVSLFRWYWCFYCLWTAIVLTCVITPWLINCTLKNDYIVVWVQFDEELVCRVRSGISMGLISNNNTRWQSAIGVVSVCVVIGFGFVYANYGIISITNEGSYD
ncbi:hypothetical protein M3Y96_00604300 [Aphelenchoides besseyi]|nr:hypothetical protein M3Y96_00604300 [Aphelenchoides besseyi]